MQLRPYQQTTVNKCIARLNSGGNALISLPTGAGKSIILGHIIKELAGKIPGFRCCLIIDRETLVRQLTETFTMLGLDVGNACASVSKDVVLDKQITVASRQTLINHLCKMGAVHLIICDEAHLVALHPSDSQYTKIIDKLVEHNPKARLLGCTATAYRLDSGYIYGDRHRSDLIPHWESITDYVSFSELTGQGYLCPLKGKIIGTVDLSGVGMIAGEFNLGELSEVMCKFVDIVQEVIDIDAAGHDKILCFAVDIKHVEAVVAATENSVAYHSKQTKEEHTEAMEGFKSGRYRMIVSVAQLSIGFDYPAASCALMLRPTMSPSLYVQMIGRVLRPHNGKTNALLIDLVSNTEKHCPSLDLDKVHVKVPWPPGGGVPPIKYCNEPINGDILCMAENHPAAIFCICCGAEFPRKTIPEEFRPDLKAVDFEATGPQVFDVDSLTFNKHQSKKNDKWLLRVSLHTGGYVPQTANIWLMFDDFYSGFAVTKSLGLWGQLSDDQFPDNVDEAEWLAERFHTPETMTCLQTPEGYLNVVSLNFADTPF